MKKEKIKIVTIGGATEDIFLHYKNPEVLIKREKENEKRYILFEEGRKIDVQSLAYHTGGGATNSAFTFKRMGFDVSPVFKIAQDVQGQFILSELKKEKINTENVVYCKKFSTATSFVFPCPSGDRIIFAYRGANVDLRKEHIPVREIEKSKLIYITSLSGKSGSILEDILKITKKNNVSVALNPGYGQIKDFNCNFIDCLKSIDTLIVNSFEARCIFQMMMDRIESLKNYKIKVSELEYEPSLLNKFYKHHNKCIGINIFFNEILKIGPKTIIVTNGPEGVYVAQKNLLFFHKSLPVKNVVNTLGAGDAFGSCFVATLLLKNSIEKALIYGLINSSSVISHEGAKTGILNLRQIENKFSKITEEKIQKFRI